MESGGWTSPSVVVPVFNAEIHAPVRLRICSALAASPTLDFATLRDTLGLADSVVSKHVSRLEDAGYALVQKVPGGGRMRTWISLTDPGRIAFAAHMAALQQICLSSGL